jgi:hypothetical protein
MYLGGIHHIHGPEGFQNAEDKALEQGLRRTSSCRSMPQRPTTPRASASGKAAPSTQSGNSLRLSSARSARTNTLSWWSSTVWHSHRLVNTVLASRSIPLRVAAAGSAGGAQERPGRR